MLQSILRLPQKLTKDLSKEEKAWILYDVGNSAFYTTVMAGFFPVFFKLYWSAGQDETTSTFYLGISNTIASLVVALLAPVLGAVADIGGMKRPILFFFTVLGVLFTACLFFVDKGNYQMAMALYALATVGVASSVSIYDSQLTDVTTESNYHSISSLGYAAGYLGGGVLFAINVAMTLFPAVFGLPDSSEGKTLAVQISFLMVAVWWMLFAIPLLRHVPDKERDISPLMAVRTGLKELIGTMRSMLQNKNIVWFLVAYWLYIDGVGTVIKMAVDYGMTLGFKSDNLIVALLITQFVGIPGSILMGRIGNKTGPKIALYIGIAIYGLVSLYSYFMSSPIDFYVLAVVIGLVQGGVQALSRSLFASIIPPEKSGEYFGFYNMLGKFAAVLGPLLIGIMVHLTGNARLGMPSVIVFFISGGLLLTRVQTPDSNQSGISNLDS